MQAQKSSETIWFADSPLPPVRVAKPDRRTGKSVLVSALLALWISPLMNAFN
jgi:hypothetical protein